MHLNHPFTFDGYVPTLMLTIVVYSNDFLCYYTQLYFSPVKIPDTSGYQHV